MKSTDVKPSRFSEAKRRVEKWLNNLRFNDQAALILVTTEPKVIAPLSSDHARLRRSLGNLEASDAHSDIGTALRLAAALVANRPNATIVLVSDGSFSPVADFSPGSAKLVYEPVGKSDLNAGFCGRGRKAKRQASPIVCGIAEFLLQTAQRNFEFLCRREIERGKGVDIAAKSTQGRTRFSPDSGAACNVEVGMQRRCFSRPTTKFTSSVQGINPFAFCLLVRENFFPERALALEPDCIVDKSAQVPETEKGEGLAGRYDFVIFDGTKPEPVKAKAVWLVGVADGNFVKGVGNTEQPVVASWERDHPVLRFIDLSAVLIDKALKVQLAPWAQAIVGAKDTTLFAVGERAGKRWLFIGFNLLDSDFLLRVSFPIFIANALKWSVGGRKLEQGFIAKSGSVVSLVVPSTEVILRHPDGPTETLNAPDHLLTLRLTDKVGVYELQSGNLKTLFAVNLLNADESDIAPRQTVTLGARTVAAQTQSLTWRELWWLAILLALLVLAVEWLVFIRWS